MTAVWENQLDDVKDGKISLDDFYQGQISELKKLVEQVKISAEKLPPQQKNKTAPCPKCGENLIQWKSKFADEFYWRCSNKDCNLTLADSNGEPFIKKCPDCGEGFIVKRKGNFWACNNYPNCKKTFQDENNLPKILKE